MGVPREVTYLIAYKKYSEERKSSRVIAAEMTAEGHKCGGHTTALRWIKEGRRLVHYDEDGMNDPMRKRGIRREVTSDTFDALFVQIEADMKAGDLSYAEGRRLQLRALENYVHLHGLRRAPELPKVKDPRTGEKRPVVPAALLDALGGIPADEWIEALHSLPDERTER